MKCHYCGKTLTKGDSFIKFEDDRTCSDCSYSDTITIYFVGGEFLATDDDGVEYYVPANKLYGKIVPKQEREQKYLVNILDEGIGAYLIYYPKSGNYGVTGILDNNKGITRFTEQEIKDYDERYWPFAVKVEELEE